MNRTDSRPIGVFDSGVGGLTVVAELIKALPGEDIIYFGDTARVPYGTKSKETVTKYACEIMDFLITQDVKAVVIACNTVSSNSYEEITKRYNLPVIEMVSAGVSAVRQQAGKSIAVIGTEATVRSMAYKTALEAEGYSVIQKACPLFVPLAEEGLHDHRITELTVMEYLSGVSDSSDAILLGCTHYPLLAGCIERVTTLPIINPAAGASRLLADLLTEREIKSNKTNAKHRFYISDKTDKFNTICKLVLNRDYTAVRREL